MRWMTAAVAALGLVLSVAPAHDVRAQDAPPRWNDERTLALVRQATERRARQLADSGLVDYRAQAHGYLTFLGQLGEGFREPPRIVKADELLLEVYWRAPDLSKQRIVGQRDTLLLPTDINYHRDHLGIVQNNFPSIIRLGDGDEVLDVPHPLSPEGLGEYDFAVGDSLRISYPGRTVVVDIMRVRPKDDTKPRVVGAVFVERETAQVVRMAFSFTRSAFRDDGLEDISVVLESSLVDGRFWLPSRQEIEIRRSGTVMDFPARGIIRGRWEICCYAVNTGIPPSFFRGPEIVYGATRPTLRARFAGSGRILDSLPQDVRAVTDEDVKRVQEEARALVREQALARRRGTGIAARGISDIVRVNRVEGLAIGAAVARRRAGLSASIATRYGLEDERVKARLAVGVQRASGRAVDLLAYDDFRDVRDEAEVSGVRNSIAAQEFGSDFSDPYGARGAGARVTLPWFGAVWRLEGGYERQAPLEIHATPATGRFEALVPAVAREGARVALAAERPTALTILGVEARAVGELRLMDMKRIDGGERARVMRGFLSLHAQRPVGRLRLVSHTTAATAVTSDGDVPAQELVHLGGPTSAPGYELRAFTARTGITQRVEARLPIPFVPIPLGRFGRAPGGATLAPYLHAVYADRVLATPRGEPGVYPSVGVALLAPFDLLRIDVARGLRGGRWMLSIDLAREFWSVL